MALYSNKKATSTLPSCIDVLPTTKVGGFWYQRTLHPCECLTDSPPNGRLYVGGFHPSSTMMILSEQIKISKPYIPTTKLEGFTADFGKYFSVLFVSFSTIIICRILSS